MLLLTKIEKTYKEQKFCQLCKEEFNQEFNEDVNYCKVPEHCHYKWKYRGTVQSICDLRYRKAHNQSATNRVS